MVRLFSWRKDHGQYLLKSGARCSLDQARVLLASSKPGEFLPPVATIHHCPCLIRRTDGSTAGGMPPGSERAGKQTQRCAWLAPPRTV